MNTTPVTKIRERSVERELDTYAPDGSVEDSARYFLGDSGWYEPFTNERKQLLQVMQSMYGRCVSRMYQTDKALGDRPIGWVFERKRQYEDTGKYGRPAQYYIHETWVELAPDSWSSGL